MEKKKWKVTVLNGDVLITKFDDEAISAKGVEKKNKAKFKEFRRLGYKWTVEEVS